jgi:hypothetical protein
MWFTSIKVETETKRDDSVELSRFFCFIGFSLNKKGGHNYEKLFTVF